jgi:hypothetical protein
MNNVVKRLKSLRRNQMFYGIGINKLKKFVRKSRY